MRYLELDFIRGIAIILMVIFHLSYDLNYFHFITIDIYNQHSHFWYYFRLIIVSLFVGTVGASIAVTYEFHYNIKKILRQVTKLALSSLSITLVSYIMFPNYYIYFGILHFITLAFILSLPFARYPISALIGGIIIIILTSFDIISTHPLFNFLQPLLSLPQRTKDLANFFPWFGVVLVGIYIGKNRLFRFQLKDIPSINKIVFLGQHSLLIYLIHQPLLYGITMLLYYYSKN